MGYFLFYSFGFYSSILEQAVRHEGILHLVAVRDVLQASQVEAPVLQQGTVRANTTSLRVCPWHGLSHVMFPWTSPYLIYSLRLGASSARASQEQGLRFANQVLAFWKTPMRIGVQDLF